MSVNMIERNGSDCKYVEIFTHRLGSIGAPSRRTVFIRGTNTKQLAVPKIAGKNTKSNFWQKENAEFKATTDLQRNMHQDVYFYVKNVDLISPRQKCNYMEYEGKNDTTDWRKFLQDALKLIGISGRDKVPNCRGKFQLEPD
jgi:hypothetical protein